MLLSKVIFLLLEFLILEIKSSTYLQISFNFNFPSYDEYLEGYKSKILDEWDSQEYAKRSQIYFQNINKILQGNCIICEINNFTDWTEKQYTDYLKQLTEQEPEIFAQKRDQETKQSKIQDQLIHYSKRLLTNTNPPLTLNWSILTNNLTSFKNQGVCNSWSFVTTNYFQFVNLINNANSLSKNFSSQYLLTCLTKSFKCNLTLPHYAYDFILGNGGLPSQSLYPTSNNFTSSLQMCQTTDLTSFSSENAYGYKNLNDNEFIKKLLVKRPLSVLLNCESANNRYSKLINQTTNILLIGYNQTHWIFKGSKGASWEESGYFYLDINLAQSCGFGDYFVTTGISSSSTSCGITNCQKCIQDYGCSKCSTGYYVSNNDGMQSCELCSNAACQQCQDFYGGCKLCKYMYSLYLRNQFQTWQTDYYCSAARQDNIGCSFYANNICKQCHIGYTLNQNFICARGTLTCAVNNCTSCTFNNYCGNCTSLYLPNQNGLCVLKCKIQNCLSCDQYNYVCTLCTSGYALNVISTLRVGCKVPCSVSNCNKCSSTDTCSQCAGNYSLKLTPSPPTCVYLCPIPNCSVCSIGSTVCTTCSTNYQIASNGSCISTCSVTNCILCSTPTYCQYCSGNYTLKIVSSTVSSCSLRCEIEYCTACSAFNTCSSCQTNYTLTSNKCQPLCTLTNCATCLQPNNCSICQSSYKLIMYSINQTGICRKQCTVENCQYCTTLSTNCTLCKTNYILNANFTCEIQCTTTNCKWCLRPNLCQLCSDGYSLVTTVVNSVANNSCVLKCDVKYCKTCSTSSVCSQCMANYSLNQSGTVCSPSCSITQCTKCTTPNVCSACSAHYTLYKDSNGLLKCQLICSVLSCKSCSSYNICNQCSSGYQLSNANQCNPICSDTECIECDGPQKCSKCSPDYQLSHFSTQLFPTCKISCGVSNCKLCSIIDKCSQCITNYILNNQICQPNCKLTANCNKCTIPSLCTECESNYTLQQHTNALDKSISKKCQPNCQLQHCLSCSLPNICSICSINYTLINNTCQPLSATCKDMMIWNKNKCQCPIKYYYQSNGNSNGICLQCPNNCIKCINSTYCLFCIASYSLSSTNDCSKKCQIQYCLLCQQNITKNVTISICRKCEFNYYYNTTSNKCMQSKMVTFIPTTTTTTTTNSSNNSNYITISSLIQTSQIQQRNWFIVQLDQISILANVINVYGYCLPNCKNCKNYTYCYQCYYGYYLDSGLCFKCNENCQLCQLYQHQVQQNKNNNVQDPNNSNKITVKQIVCKKCFKYYEFKHNSCIKCPNQCIKCQEETLNCLQCSVGYYLSNSTTDGIRVCIKCSSIDNCLQCSSDNKCIKCKDGYALFGSNTSNSNSNSLQNQNASCFSCISNKGCNACNASNLTQCLTCIEGYYLINQTQECSPCPKQCRQCIIIPVQSLIGNYSNSSSGQTVITTNSSSINNTNNINNTSTSNQSANANTTNTNNSKSNSNSQFQYKCTSCLPGYYLNKQNYQCIRICNDSNCIKCSRNYAICQQCFAGYQLRLLTSASSAPLSNACVFVLNCNIDHSCIVCPEKYYYFNETCINCPNIIQNCQYCQTSIPSNCLQCQSKYYLSQSGKCESCSPQCLTCIEYKLCYQCIFGYYLENQKYINSSVGHCNKCQQPCASCKKYSNKCISCITGYQLNQQNLCLSKQKVSFKIRLQLTFQNYLSQIKNIFDSLKILFNLTDSNNLKFSKVYKGSTVVQGYFASPSSQSASSAFRKAGQSLTKGSALGNLIILQASVSYANLNNDQDGGIMIDANQIIYYIKIGIFGIVILIFIFTMTYGIRKYLRDTQVNNIKGSELSSHKSVKSASHDKKYQILNTTLSNGQKFGSRTLRSDRQIDNVDDPLITSQRTKSMQLQQMNRINQEILNLSEQQIKKITDKSLYNNNFKNDKKKLKTDSDSQSDQDQFRIKRKKPQAPQQY